MRGNHRMELYVLPDGILSHDRNFVISIDRSDVRGCMENGRHRGYAKKISVMAYIHGGPTCVSINWLNYFRRVKLNKHTFVFNPKFENKKLIK